jgi:hypothetical protein
VTATAGDGPAGGTQLALPRLVVPPAVERHGTFPITTATSSTPRRSAPWARSRGRPAARPKAPCMTVLGELTGPVIMRRVRRSPRERSQSPVPERRAVSGLAPPALPAFAGDRKGGVGRSSRGSPNAGDDGR